MADAFAPAQSVRYLAYTALKQQGDKALPVLQSIYKANDPILKRERFGCWEAFREKVRPPFEQRWSISIQTSARWHGASCAATEPT
jgi:hypothetical protein